MTKPTEERVIHLRRDLSFEQVDIFLRVQGRLPTEKGDGLTQEILDTYCEKYRKGKLTKGIIPLEYMYDLIVSGQITSTGESKNEK